MTTTLTLTQEELDELERLMMELSDDLLVEIRRSDNRDFRHGLERRYQLHNQILARIREAKQVAA